MTLTTTRLATLRVNLRVEEIVIGDRPGIRGEGFARDPRRTILWIGAAAALLVTGFAVTRATQPDPVIAAPATVDPSTALPAAQPVFVHVAGAVAKPGLYRFPEGMRVADAIEAAGGPAAKADLDAINLADLLTDGLKIDVPWRGREASMAAGPSPTPGPVDINTADQVALETVPGVGPVTATAILQHRTEIGRYESVEQLLDVTGIGPATLEALRPYVTV